MGRPAAPAQIQLDRSDIAHLGHDGFADITARALNISEQSMSVG
jgi:hypothetical protein